MAAWLGPAITAAGSILGSLFGGKKEKSENQINYKDMAKDAEEAGFNPLTAIRNGGSAGYTQTSHPALSSGEFIANAMSSVGNLVSSIDPMRDATAKLEYEIQQATLANIQADTAARSRVSIGGVPVATGSARVASAGAPLASKDWFAPPSPTGALPIWVPGVDRDGRPAWIANPEGPDAEQMGAAYLTRSISGWEAAVGAGLGAVANPGSVIRRVPVTPPTGRDRHGPKSVSGWLPSFSINWK